MLTKQQLKQMSKAIDEVARRKGTSSREVRDNLEELIAATASNPDPAAQALFSQCPRRGRLPTGDPP